MGSDGKIAGYFMAKLSGTTQFSGNFGVPVFLNHVL